MILSGKTRGTSRSYALLGQGCTQAKLVIAIILLLTSIATFTDITTLIILAILDYAASSARPETAETDVAK